MGFGSLFQGKSAGIVVNKDKLPGKTANCTKIEQAVKNSQLRLYKHGSGH